MEQKPLNLLASLPLTSKPEATPAPIPMRHAVHFSSQTDLWATPQKFFDHWNAAYNFELDVCALPGNAKCFRYFTPEQDGLKQRWTGVCWMNPPYGREIGAWVRKAYQSAQEGATVVCLLPSRTDTRWWHSFVVQASEVHFIQGRLKFGNSKNSAPFPSVVVVFLPPLSLFVNADIDNGKLND